ncbi:MAG TPA: small metal-binding protein SmbP [Nitrospira sp.]|nr:small metal-binding protein SmbP [Terriglobales bacterium]HKT36031.1 small metal-binding protein SmbP [Nitrospira sp.]
MQQKWLRLSFSGCLLLLLGSASYAADTPADMTVSPQPEAATAPFETTVAAETPADARVSSMSDERMATDPCASQSAAASLDCEKLKRRVSTPKTGEASSMAACTTHMDAKGNVVFDDPACPSRIRPVVNDPGRAYLIRENPFFSLHIDKATDHALRAEIAGKQGRAIDLLDHAQMALLQAKEAQRAGNLPGLSEGIIQLTEALRLPEGTSVREATAYVRDARKNLHQAAGSKLKPVEQFENVAAYRE